MECCQASNIAGDLLMTVRENLNHDEVTGRLLYVLCHQGLGVSLGRFALQRVTGYGASHRYRIKQGGQGKSRMSARRRLTRLQWGLTPGTPDWPHPDIDACKPMERRIQLDRPSPWPRSPEAPQT
jgi:hypothetical protein